MASLLPLLHDLLPIFMPSKVQVARGSELVAVEERAQRAPWYQQQPRLDRPSKDCDIDIADAAKASSPDMTGEVLEPIRLLDYEEKHASPGHEEGSGASMPHYTGEDASLSAQRRNGPKVIHQNAMVGLSDKMCVTGKPRLLPLIFVSLSCFFLAVFGLSMAIRSLALVFVSMQFNRL